MRRVAIGSLGLQAVSNATGATNRTAAAVFSWLMGLTMPESLSRHQNDHARWLLGDFRNSWLHRHVEHLGHRLGGRLLSLGGAEKDRRRGNPGRGQITGLGDIPAGLAKPVTDA